MRPLNKVKIEWSPNFAYAIGLVTTDGCLSKDGRHLDFTSKDLELVKTFKSCLSIGNVIGKKRNGAEIEKKYFRIQFGDICFYRFLLDIGLTPNKSKTLSSISVPRKYFFDFLRGHLDGDGTFYSYFDPRWRSSYMFYTVFASASKKHILWLQKEISRLLKIKGHITRNPMKTYHQLKYAKSDSLKLLRKIYYSKEIPCLKRKRLKIDKALRKIGQSLEKS